MSVSTGTDGQVRARFGPYGGRFVPETVIAALDELNRAHLTHWADPGFRAELDGLLARYVGRPTPLYRARRLEQVWGLDELYLKREDLCHTGAHKINNALGQVLLAARMGKRRIIAETGAGQHGVATATAAALLGLECCVYMGRVDTHRQRLNVVRMRMLGAEVRPVDSGIGTLKDALNEAIRDWVTNVADTHYVIGTAAGPAPYPEIVAQLQLVIGDEARAQMLDEAGRLPAAVVACIGGGSNAIGMFRAFLDDAEVDLIGVEAGGEGIDSGRHGASLTQGQPGVLHGTYSYLLQTEDGQVAEPHSISAGLDYPGVGPEHSHLRDTGRVQYVAATDAEALEAFQTCSRAEGIIPALESSHALALVAREGAARAGEGRCFCACRAEGIRTSTRPGRPWASMSEGAQRIRRAFAEAGRPLFMPYVLGGYPTLDRAAEHLAAVVPHADLIELGIPFSDPMADGPTIQAAGQQALDNGVRPEQVIELAEDHRGGPPIVVMTYLNIILATGSRAFMERSARAGIAGVIIPDLPIDEGDEVRQQARRAGVSVIPLAAPTTTDERLDAIGRRADGFVYCVSVAGVTGGDVAVDAPLRSFLARARQRIDAPLAVGFGIRTPEQVAAVGEISDGVIVASELIRRLGAADSPAAGDADVVAFCAAARSALGHVVSSQ